MVDKYSVEAESVQRVTKPFYLNMFRNIDSEAVPTVLLTVTVAIKHSPHSCFDKRWDYSAGLVRDTKL